MAFGCTFYFCYSWLLIYTDVVFKESDLRDWCPSGTSVPIPSEVVMLYDLNRIPYLDAYSRHLHIVQMVNGSHYVMTAYPPKQGEVFYEYFMMRHKTEGNESVIKEYITHKVCITSTRWLRFLYSNNVIYYVTYGFVMSVLSVMIIYLFLFLIGMCTATKKSRGGKRVDDMKNEKEYEGVPLEEKV